MSVSSYYVMRKLPKSGFPKVIAEGSTADEAAGLAVSYFTQMRLPFISAPERAALVTALADVANYLRISGEVDVGSIKVCNGRVTLFIQAS